MPFGEAFVLPISDACWPAIRPRAVWRSMEGMRPYHTLLLTSNKSEILDFRYYKKCFPVDSNRSLDRYVCLFLNLLLGSSLSFSSHLRFEKYTQAYHLSCLHSKQSVSNIGFNEILCHYVTFTLTVERAIGCKISYLAYKINHK